MHPAPRTIRTRWAALGAAVAITLGASGIGVVSATIDTGERTSFVPITPCRLMDSRLATNIGPRNTPIGQQEELVVAAHGINGDCTITDQAAGLVLNITAVDPTAATNLRIFPADQPLPTTSNLNPFPGSPPTPNSVTTGLDASGQFTIFNAFGQVDVVADVVGFYEDHNHDDRYPLREAVHEKTDVYTKSQVDARTGSPRSEVILGGDFQPESAVVGYDRPAGAFRFVATDDACAFAPVHLVGGTLIGRIEVVYLTTSPVPTMTVELLGRSLASGSNPSNSGDAHLVSARLSGLLQKGTVQTLRTDLPQRVELRDDFAYALQICTDDTIEIRQTDVGPGPLVIVDPAPIDPIPIDPGI